MKDIEHLIKEVDASMSMENMPLAEEDKKRIRYYAENPDKADDILKQLIRKHMIADEGSHEQRL